MANVFIHTSKESKMRRMFAGGGKKRDVLRIRRSVSTGLYIPEESGGSWMLEWRDDCKMDIK